MTIASVEATREVYEQVPEKILMIAQDSGKSQRLKIAQDEVIRELASHLDKFMAPLDRNKVTPGSDRQDTLVFELCDKVKSQELQARFYEKTEKIGRNQMKELTDEELSAIARGGRAGAPKKA